MFRLAGASPDSRPSPGRGGAPGGRPRGASRGRLVILPAPARESSLYMALGDSAGLGCSLGAGAERFRGTYCGWFAGTGCR